MALYEANIPAIAPQSENTGIDGRTINGLKKS
jgi:hypothetical protein